MEMQTRCEAWEPPVGFAAHRAARRAADKLMTGADEAAIDDDLKKMVEAQRKADAQAGSGDHVSPLHAVRRRPPPPPPASTSRAL